MMVRMGFRSMFAPLRSADWGRPSLHGSPSSIPTVAPKSSFSIGIHTQLSSLLSVYRLLVEQCEFWEKTAQGKKMNTMSFEEWAKQGKAPVLEHSLKVFNELKGAGVHIILVSSRRECLRSVTVDNLVDVGYHGWTSLVLRSVDDESKDVGKFKADVRKQLIGNGYRIWGVLGDQWTSIQGLPSAKRSFKLPNPLYYVA